MAATLADSIFKCILLNENVRIPLNFVPEAPIYNNPALVQKMAWCQKDDKPLSEPMLTLFTDATRERWVNIASNSP